LATASWRFFFSKLATPGKSDKNWAWPHPNPEHTQPIKSANERAQIPKPNLVAKRTMIKKGLAA